MCMLHKKEPQLRSRRIVAAMAVLSVLLVLLVHAILASARHRRKENHYVCVTCPPYMHCRSSFV
jgi:hypothetical protein